MFRSTLLELMSWGLIYLYTPHTPITTQRGHDQTPELCTLIGQTVLSQGCDPFSLGLDVPDSCVTLHLLSHSWSELHTQLIISHRCWLLFMLSYKVNMFIIHYTSAYLNFKLKPVLVRCTHHWKPSQPSSWGQGGTLWTYFHLCLYYTATNRPVWIRGT